MSGNFDLDGGIAISERDLSQFQFAICMPACQLHSEGFGLRHQENRRGKSVCEAKQNRTEVYEYLKWR